MSGGTSLPTDSPLSLRSANYPGRSLTIRDGLLHLDTVDTSSNASLRAAVTLTVVPGLAGPAGYSLPAADDRYLRHRAFGLWVDPHENSDVYRSDRSFESIDPGRDPLRPASQHPTARGQNRDSGPLSGVSVHRPIALPTANPSERKRT
ncbi:AbfB domain-containing protein [Streptomyces sp. NPDC102441]|uniref:AbfB domain-containing protein n=1 Tax=Streptomyces sp. NPDC102441 TaxID=3366176 RepID=UPI0037FAB276